MRKTLLPVLLLIILFIFADAKKTGPGQEPVIYFHETSLCGAQAPSAIEASKDGKYINVIAGTGNHHYPVHTSSDSAQIYFDQGLTFYYSYHFPEALASFKEATRFDVNCTMAYWGQALALGPYYNNYSYKMSSAVPAALVSLQRSNTGASTKENDLANAMLQRYSSDTTNADRKQLDQHYAEAMKLVSVKYPADNDIKVLYIDAVMLCHKWDFWNNDGIPKAWTPELVTLCEGVLKIEPQQPAALHYYIHLTEASRHPEAALPYADVLKDLMPGVAHMVHMSTHSYQRNGLYAKGVDVNEQANTIYSKMDSAAPYLHLSKNNPIHFFAVQSYCAMNAGMYVKGKPLYLRARESMAAMKPFYSKDPYAQFIYTLPEIACVRLGKWQEILKEPSPNAQWKYAVILDDFAKGMAYIRNHDITAARKCLGDLQTNLSDSLLGIRRMPYNKPRQVGELAAGILTGEIFFAEGKTAEAITALKNAVDGEDQLIYREPQEWFIPSRQYLGSCLLKVNRAAEAEKVYREDLVANPGNGWSLLGLCNSLKAQNRVGEAAKYKPLYQKAFEAGDIKPVDSVF
jgi:tetratricopeptide (TPR) repeat protein